MSDKSFNQATADAINSALHLPYSSIIRNGSNEWESRSNNSKTFSTNPFDLTEALRSLLPDCKNIHCTVNVIDIDGTLDPDEKPHYHDSWVVGIIVRGEGDFITEKNGKKHVEKAGRGDIVVIPKGTYHVFEGKQLLVAGIEFGKPGEVLYQRHEYGELPGFDE